MQHRRLTLRSGERAPGELDLNRPSQGVLASSWAIVHRSGRSKGAREMSWQGDHGHRLTFSERLEIQQRVRSGESFVAAATAVGCSSKSVQRLLAKTGGVKPRTKPRSALRLSLADREEISRGLLLGESS